MRRDRRQQTEPEEPKDFFDTTAFMLKKPCSDTIFRGPFRLRNRDAYRQLIELAKSKKLYVWHCAVQKVDGAYHAMPLHLIDWDSVPDVPYGSVPATIDSVDPLVCTICHKRCSSTSGLTLHMKAHEQPEEQPDESPLKCPDCGKICTSTSGLTMHRKSHG